MIIYFFFILFHIFRFTKVIRIFILNGYPSGSPYLAGICTPEPSRDLVGLGWGWYMEWMSGTGMGIAFPSNICPRLHPYTYFKLIALFLVDKLVSYHVLFNFIASNSFCIASYHALEVIDTLKFKDWSTTVINSSPGWMNTFSALEWISVKRRNPFDPISLEGLYIWMWLKKIGLKREFVVLIQARQIQHLVVQLG